MKARLLKFSVATITLIGAIYPYPHPLTAQTSAKDNTAQTSAKDNTTPIIIAKSNLNTAISDLEKAQLINAIPDKIQLLREAQESAQRALSDLNIPPASAPSTPPTDPVAAARYNLRNALLEVKDATKDATSAPKKKALANAAANIRRALNFLAAYAAPPKGKLTVQGGSARFLLDSGENKIGPISPGSVGITFKQQIASIRVYIPPNDDSGPSSEQDFPVTNNWTVTLVFRDWMNHPDSGSTMTFCSNQSCIPDDRQVTGTTVYFKDDGNGKFYNPDSKTKPATYEFDYDRLNTSQACQGSLTSCNHIATVIVKTTKAVTAQSPTTFNCPLSGANNGMCTVYLSYQ